MRDTRFGCEIFSDNGSVFASVLQTIGFGVASSDRMEVHYCHVCGTKVSSDAISGGAAVRSAANRIICRSCVSDIKPDAEAPALRTAPKKLMQRREDSHAKPHVKDAHASPQGLGYFAGAVVLLIAGMLIFFAPTRFASNSTSQAHAERVSPPAESLKETKKLPVTAEIPMSNDAAPPPTVKSISREKLLAYWTFDEISGDVAKDASGNGHDGTMVNDPLPTPGKFGGALGFFGKQYVIIKKPEGIELGSSDFTYSAWVKTRNAGGLLSKTSPSGGWADHGKMIFVAEHAGKLRVDSHGVSDNSSTTALADNSWRHVAVIFSNEKKVLKMFIDGKDDGTFEVPLMPDPSNFEMRLGFGPGSSHTIQFTGLMDDVAIYGRVLKPGEIESLANGSRRP